MANAWRLSNLLFTMDFDNTCISEDATINLIELSGKEQVIKEYKEILHKHESRVKDYVEQIPKAELRDVLGDLGWYEKEFNKEVMKAGLVGGLKRKAIRERVKERHELFPGCAEVILKLGEFGRSIHIISANWSEDNIVGTLSSLLEDSSLLCLHCNDLKFGPDGISDGTFSMKIATAIDKEDCMIRLKEEFKGERAVYLGDSPTDLLALLEADLGIVIGDSENLRRLASRFDIELLPLHVAAEEIGQQSAISYSQQKKLFLASGWEEIAPWFLKLKP